jgi:hypothetical protein
MNKQTKDLIVTLIPKWLALFILLMVLLYYV